jgi:hypothetical protein
MAVLLRRWVGRDVLVHGFNADDVHDDLIALKKYIYTVYIYIYIYVSIYKMIFLSYL